MLQGEGEKTCVPFLIDQPRLPKGHVLVVTCVLHREGDATFFMLFVAGNGARSDHGKTESPDGQFGVEPTAHSQIVAFLELPR